jgi:hypothetical protein
VRGLLPSQLDFYRLVERDLSRGSYRGTRRRAIGSPLVPSSTNEYQRVLRGVREMTQRRAENPNAFSLRILPPSGTRRVMTSATYGDLLCLAFGGSARAVEDRSQPWHRSAGSRERFVLRREFALGVIGDRGPHAHVLGIASELLETKAAIGPREDVDAPVNSWGRRTRQNIPGRIEPSRHRTEPTTERFVG